MIPFNKNKIPELSSCGRVTQRGKGERQSPQGGVVNRGRVLGRNDEMAVIARGVLMSCDVNGVWAIPNR